MACNKKPRKAYRPRPATTPILFAVPRSTTLDLKIEPHTALEKLRSGLADAVDVQTLVSRFNVALLATKRFNHQPDSQAAARTTLHAGLVALVEIRNRHQKIKAWGASGDQYRAISAALILADDLHDACTRRELRDDLVTLHAINCGKSGAEGDLIEVA